MEYLKVAQTTDLLSGGKKRLQMEGKDILLANIQGSYYAVDNTCPHMGGSLYSGKMDGTDAICSRHGLRVDVTTGKVAKTGKSLLLKVKQNQLPTYPVKVEGTDVLIGIE